MQLWQAETNFWVMFLLFALNHFTSSKHLQYLKDLIQPV